MTPIQLTLDKVFGEILKEFVKAEKKHPGWPGDIVHAAAILQEECGELMKACLQYHFERGSIMAVEKELYQTGAMVFRLALGIQQGYKRIYEGTEYEGLIQEKTNDD